MYCSVFHIILVHHCSSKQTIFLWNHLQNINIYFAYSGFNSNGERTVLKLDLHAAPLKKNIELVCTWASLWPHPQPLLGALPTFKSVTNTELYSYSYYCTMMFSCWLHHCAVTVIEGRKHGYQGVGGAEGLSGRKCPGDGGLCGSGYQNGWLTGIQGRFWRMGVTWSFWSFCVLWSLWRSLARGTMTNAAAVGESGCDECTDYSGRVMDEAGLFKSEVVVRISNVALTCYWRVLILHLCVNKVSTTQFHTVHILNSNSPLLAVNILRRSNLCNSSNLKQGDV